MKVFGAFVVVLLLGIVTLVVVQLRVMNEHLVIISQKVSTMMPSDPATLTEALYSAAEPKLTDLRASEGIDKPKFIKESETEVSPEVYVHYRKIHPNGMFYDIWRQEGQVIGETQNILKTESVTSPYMGYITLEYTTSTSEPFVSKEEASKAPLQESSSKHFKKRFTYAFQGGKWIYKSTDDEPIE